MSLFVNWGTGDNTDNFKIRQASLMNMIEGRTLTEIGRHKPNQHHKIHGFLDEMTEMANKEASMVSESVQRVLNFV